MALLAGSAVGFAPAFIPTTGVTKNQSTALNGMFEVIIGTGTGDGGGTDDKVLLTLTDKKGTSHQDIPIKDGRDNYEKGALDYNTAIEYPDVSEPTEFTLESYGDWSFGSIFVTNLETGICYHCVEPGSGTKINKYGRLSNRLTEIKPTGRTADEYSTYEVNAGPDSTDDDVFIKVIDVNGKAGNIQKIASAGKSEIWNNSGVDNSLSNPAYILVGKFGNDDWNPRKFTVQGKNGNFYGGDGPFSTYFPGVSLNSNNGNWRFLDDVA